MATLSRAGAMTASGTGVRTAPARSRPPPASGISLRTSASAAIAPWTAPTASHRKDRPSAGQSWRSA